MPTKDPEKLKLKRQRYYQKHKESVRSRFLKWKENNRDRYNELKRNSYKNNTEKEHSRNKIYRENNIEKIRKYKKEYNFKATRSFTLKPSIMFKSIQQRIKYHPRYQKRKLLIGKEEFVKWVLANENYKKLFKEWEEMRYEYVLTPTVDRIDNKRDYTLDNIQIITLIQNSTKRDCVV